jgi:hypothetical protein
VYSTRVRSEGPGHFARIWSFSETCRSPRSKDFAGEIPNLVVDLCGFVPRSLRSDLAFWAVPILVGTFVDIARGPRAILRLIDGGGLRGFCTSGRKRLMSQRLFVCGWKVNHVRGNVRIPILVIPSSPFQRRFYGIGG